MRTISCHGYKRHYKSCKSNSCCREFASRNLFVGFNSGSDAGDNSTGVGNNALGSGNNIGTTNSAFGIFSLFNNTTGSFNNGFGALSLFNNTSGNNNSAIGSSSLINNQTGNNNTAVGVNSLLNNNNSNNTAFGVNCIVNNTNGDSNSAFGTSALFDNIEGRANTAFGTDSLGFMISGDQNTAIGILAGSKLITGNNNLYLGSYGQDGDDETIRIGEQLIHSRAFITGVNNISIDEPNQSVVLIDNVTGQLGSVWTPGNSQDWADPAPTNINDAINRMASLLATLNNAPIPL